MKIKYLFFISALLLSESFATTFFRVDAGAYIASKTGVMGNIGFQKQFDEMIGLTGELGFAFLAKSEKEVIDQDSTIGNGVNSSQLKAFQRLYLIPTMIGVQVNIPVKIKFKPYVMAAIGGNLLVESVKEGDSNNASYINGYGGFAWRLGGGGWINLGSKSRFFVESYAHWAKVYRFNQPGRFLQLTGGTIMVGLEFGSTS